MNAPSIRPEQSGDAGGIRAVHLAAFAGPVEAQLVDDMRSEGTLLHSVVAVTRTQVVGHAAFARGWIEPDVPIVTVGPVGVRPEHQRAGVGSALMRSGIEQCRQAGQAAVFLLGDPGYYTRFGFSVAAAASYESPYSGSDFQMLEWRPGVLPPSGVVRYPEAFTKLG